MTAIVTLLRRFSLAAAVFLTLLLASCQHREGSASFTEAERMTVDSIVNSVHGIDATRNMADSYKQSGNILGQMLALRKLGKLYREDSQFMQAIDCHQQELQIATGVNDTIGMVQALNNIGTNYRRLGSYEEAANFHQQAVMLCTEMSDHDTELARKNLVVSLNGMGNVLMSLGNEEQADSIFRLALQGERQLGSKLGQAINLANLGSIKELLGQKDSARIYYQQSLAMNQEAGSQLGVALCHIHFGELSEHDSLFADAIEEYTVAYDLLNSTDDWHWLEAVLNLARVYIKEHRYNEAHVYLDMASKTVKRIGSQEHLVRVHMLYYQLYEQTGQLRLALDNYVMGTTLEDSLMNMKKLNNIQNQRLAQERLHRQHELQLAEDDLELERSTKTIVLIASVAILLLAVSVIVLMWYRMHTRTVKQRMMQQMQQVRESFFTNITHEFRTPLTVILGLGHQLEDLNEGNMAQVRSSAKMIVRQGNSLLGLINQLLDISKVRSAVGNPKWSHANIVAFVEMIIENFRLYADNKRQELTYTHSMTALDMDFVPDYVEKILSNLLTNAIKYTPSYGKVNVTLEQSGTNRLKIQVFDTGRGIKAEALPHIFDAFFQGDMQEGDIGTGIGLSLVRLMVEGMNGTVAAESIEGQGSTFTVVLPLHNKAAGKATQDTPEPQRSQLNPVGQAAATAPAPTDGNAATNGTERNDSTPTDTPTILIVEDNQDIAYYMGMHLEGYRLLYARGGEEGFVKAQETMPDLIITDIMMPGDVNGLELCRRIRKSDLLSHIPVIIVTAKTTEADRLEGLNAGADAYLVKPFNNEELTVRVRKLMEKQLLLRQKFSQQAIGDDDQQPQGLTAQDQQFMNRLVDVVYKLMPRATLDMETVAGEMAVSRVQLNRKVLAITGQNASAYVMRLRLANAKRLLRATDQTSISEVAMRCGFEDVAYFSRIFKQSFQMTPSQYRKMDK